VSSEADVRSTFERLIPAMLAGDRDTLAELIDEDVTWHLPPFAHAKPRRGRAKAIEFLCTAPGAFYQPGSLAITPEVQAFEGDRAILLGWMTGTTRNGKPYANRYAFAMRFRGGRVIEAWELLDSKELFDQL
jgi:ketosteroid isomerase-like protein